MRNFIRNIIDRLRGFIRADAHDTTEPTVNDSTHPIPDEADFDVDRSRFVSFSRPMSAPSPGFISSPPTAVSFPPGRAPSASTSSG